MPKINGPIEPQNIDLDQFPTHRSKYGQGGLRTVKDITERDHLPYSRCEEGMIVYIKDIAEYWCLVTNARNPDDRVWSKFEGGGASSSEIDDSHITKSKTWSSYKINNEIEGMIDDSIKLDSKTWSSKKIEEEIVSKNTQIDDTKILTTKVWSSNKTNNEIISLIDDSSSNANKTWSSERIQEQIDDVNISTEKTWSSDKISKIIDDNQATLENTWSSEKISKVLDREKIIRDDLIGTETTWSSSKNKTRINDKLGYRTEFDTSSKTLTLFLNNKLKDGLRFIAKQDNSTIKLIKTGTTDEISLEYSVNDMDWVDYTIDELITLENNGDYVVFRNKTNQNIILSNMGFFTFQMTGLFEAEGSVDYLYRKNGEIFNLNPHQYRNLFMNCSSLIIPPELPATTLSNSCYCAMFEGCSGLIKTPVLPAENMPMKCYQYMFSGCSNLKISDGYGVGYTKIFTCTSDANDATTEMFFGVGGSYAGSNPIQGHTYYYYQ